MGVAERVGRCAYPLVGLCLDGEVRNGVLVLHALGCVAHGKEVRHLDVLPTILILLAHTAAALAETGIADVAFRHEHLATRGTNGHGHVGTRLLGYALVALAMVVGTHIEDGVVLAVVPAYELIVFLYEREEIVGTLFELAALLYLCEQPAA